jgi:hypothetical protein
MTARWSLAILLRWQAVRSPPWGFAHKVDHGRSQSAPTEIDRYL